MRAKEYLKQYKEAMRLVAVLQQEYDEEMDLIDNIRSSLGGDGMPRSGEISKKVENQAIKLAEKSEGLYEAKLEALRLQNKIFKTVMMVPGDAGSVLYERYIRLHKWETIADNIGYSIRQTHNLHRQGLEAIEEIINP